MEDGVKLPTFAEMRNDLFKRALEANNGHVVNAAKSIGVNFKTLYKWRRENSS